jgi:hypothetical protein
MSSRLEALEARRQALLNKCEEQRLELAYRVAQIKPAEQLTGWTRRSAGGVLKNPTVWMTAVSGLLLMMLRRRRLLSSVGWITALLALASRATAVLRMVAQLRAAYLSLKPARPPRRTD